MAEFMDLELEESVTDMNLEARLEKELLLHGCLRRDLTESQLTYLRSALASKDAEKVDISPDFWRQLTQKEKIVESPDVAPEARFAIDESKAIDAPCLSTSPETVVVKTLIGTSSQEVSCDAVV